MGSNNLVDVSDHETTSGVMWQQTGDALKGDIMPRNSSGVVEDLAANLGDENNRWSVLSCVNLVYDDIGPHNNEVSPSSGVFSTASRNYVPVTNLNVSAYCSGRPMVITLISDSSSSYISCDATSSTSSANVAVAIERDGSAICENLILGSASLYGVDTYVPPGAVKAMDFPIRGTYSYEVKIKAVGASNTVTISNCKLLVYEL